MAVMAAGMHLPDMLRDMGEAVLLLDRQRIHIGAQANGARRIAAPERADHAGPGQAAMHLAAEFGELGGHDLGGAVFLVGQLRMGMDVAADLGQLGLEVEQARNGRHGGKPLRRDGRRY